MNFITPMMMMMMIFVMKTMYAKLFEIAEEKKKYSMSMLNGK